MQTLTPRRRRVAVLGGALAAISGSSSLLLSTRHDPALGYTVLGLLAGVVVGLVFVVKAGCRPRRETP